MLKNHTTVEVVLVVLATRKPTRPKQGKDAGMPADENKETLNSESLDPKSKTLDVSLCKLCIVLLLGIEGLNMGII